MINVQENVSLKDYSTMRVGGPARYFLRVKNKDELVEATDWAAENKLALFVLGGGSNVVFGSGGFSGLVIKNEIRGIETVEAGGEIIFHACAGEHWDDVVKKSVEAGLSGIEAMSAIPGTAGATPVQNVGAYGQEIADTFIGLEAYDLQTKKFVRLDKEACKFSYRDSIFKNEAKGRYIIVKVALKLHKGAMALPFYESLQKYLDSHNIKDYSPASIRKAVMAVRARKLPDPSVIPSNGSFFKNPVVSAEKLDEIKQNFADIITFPAANGQVKLAAGWLVEHSNVPRESEGGLKLQSENALCITNPGGASFEQLIAYKNLIKQKVQDKFGIVLEEEPEIIG